MNITIHYRTVHYQAVFYQLNIRENAEMGIKSHWEIATDFMVSDFLTRRAYVMNRQVNCPITQQDPFTLQQLNTYVSDEIIDNLNLHFNGPISEKIAFPDFKRYRGHTSLYHER